jgi:hypothetical protein
MLRAEMLRRGFLAVNQGFVFSHTGKKHVMAEKPRRRISTGSITGDPSAKTGLRMTNYLVIR